MAQQYLITGSLKINGGKSNKFKIAITQDDANKLLADMLNQIQPILMKYGAIKPGDSFVAHPVFLEHGEAPPPFTILKKKFKPPFFRRRKS